jgi:2-oxoglutarate ferredoxin oxidoreductase subunit delta
MTEIVPQQAKAATPSKYRILVKNSKYCKSCGICIELCPKKALALDPETRKTILENPDACNGCGLCEFLCPDFVLMLVDNSNGDQKTVAG